MPIARRLVLMTCVLLTVSGAVRADDAAAIIKAAKAATAMAVLPNNAGSGSAFCIDAKGLFITNAHVVRVLKKDGRIALVLNAGTRDERVLNAKVVARDVKKDLAILLADKTPPGLGVFQLGSEDGLFETQPVTALGFPFGKMLVTGNGKYPSISVNVARISALRKEKDVLDLIQIDSQLNPGNSGGPLIDDKGRVIGVISSGIVASGINFAIPIGQIKTLLATPQLAVEIPTFNPDHKSDSQIFSASIVTFTQDVTKMKVQLVLGTGADAQTLDMTPAKDDPAHFTVKATPFPPAGKQAKLTISADLGGDSIEGTIDDLPLQFANKKLNLSEIASITRKDQAVTVHLRDGSELPNQPLPKESLSLIVAGPSGAADVVKPLDWTKLVALSVSLPRTATNSAYTINVLLDGKIIASTDGTIAFERPAVAEKPAIKAPPEKPADVNDRPAKVIARAPTTRIDLPTTRPQFDEDEIIARLPEAYTRHATGGAGRYLIFYFPTEQSVDVFDCLSGTIVHKIPNISPDVLLACGKDHLLLVLPGQNLIQKWSLATFQREKIAPLPGKGITKLAVMGSGANGPSLLGSESTTLFDVDQMKPISTDEKIIDAAGEYGYKACVSSDGQMFCGIIEGLGPVPYNCMQLNGRDIFFSDFGSTSNANRFAQPTADGSLIFLPDGEIYSRQLQKVEAKAMEGTTLYPTADPRYFISVRFIEPDEDSPAPAAGKKRRPKPAKGKTSLTRVSICTVADRKVIYTFNGLPEMAPKGHDDDDIVKQIHFGEPRFEYLPFANLLVALCADNERVVLHKLDVMTALAASGQDYLFVDSVPPDTFTPGKLLSYRIAVQSKAGTPQYKLESGPAGMTVSTEGEVRWAVPSLFPDESAKAIVSISDAGGEETLHAFDLVRLAVAPTRPADRARKGGK